MNDEDDKEKLRALAEETINVMQRAIDDGVSSKVIVTCAAVVYAGACKTYGFSRRGAEIMLRDYFE